MTAPVPSSPTADAIVDCLARSIVTGEYTAGSRLPAERELARTVGASRPTLREALRRLSEWGLVEARRGSGITVRPHTQWTIEVAPSFLRYVDPALFGTSAAHFLRGLLALRRSLLAATVPLISDRLPPGAIDDARSAVLGAWECRGTAQFAVADFQIMKSLVTAAAELPALWLLNRIEGMYLELACQWTMIPPPESYKEGLSAFLDQLESGDAASAKRSLIKYLEQNDLIILQLFGSPL